MAKPSVPGCVQTALTLQEGSTEYLLVSVPLTLVTGHLVSGISSTMTFPDCPRLVPRSASRLARRGWAVFQALGLGVPGQVGQTRGVVGGQGKGCLLDRVSEPPWELLKLFGLQHQEQ